MRNKLQEKIETAEEQVFGKNKGTSALFIKKKSRQCILLKLWYEQS